MMHHEHDGMRLWVEPDERLARGTIEPGSDVDLTVGVEPADASNRVQVRYRVNGGPTAAIAAEPVRHAGNAQYFKAQLPCAALCDGDSVEYTAVCQCAGRQVPSAAEAERYMSSFQVMSPAGMENLASTLTFAKGMELTPTVASRGDAWHQTVVRDRDRLKPTHLSVFVLQRNTGNPIARMPFYAEVGVTSFLPPSKPECKLEVVIRTGIQAYYSSHSTHLLYPPYGADARAWVEKLVESLCDTLSRLLTSETIDRLAGESSNAATIVSAILQKATDLATGKNIDLNNPEAVRQLLEEAIRAYAAEHDDLQLVDKNGQGPRIVWAHPMGVLATDHVGYLSFDLTRLPPDVADALALALDARRRDPNAKTDTSIWLYPMAREDARIDALAQMRFAHDAIVVKLELDVELDPLLCQPNLCESLKNLGFTSMQNPGLTDWRLSPASFATNPAALLGEDGCETLYPANVALQEFYFYQVVGLSDVEPLGTAHLQGTIKLGVAHEYRLAWYPLGHSLGQIQYTLPLAPGESVNLAIIDWTRRDVGKRTEDTKEAEQLVHNQRRDRTIAETVDASIKEYQEGSSFMAGLAHSGGVSASWGIVGLAAGTAGSIGGASSDSRGSREIAASTVQKLSDNITQASASMRELQSTVVVQTTQHEKEAIETRTVANYNHSHALTILYYEVLRHFRVVTEYVRRRPVVLSKIDTSWLEPKSQTAHWWRKDFLENRPALEAALLDKRHSEGFNALQCNVHREVVSTRATPFSAPVPAPKRRFFYFKFEIGVGGWALGEQSSHYVEIRAYLLYRGNTVVELGRDPFSKLNSLGSFRERNRTNTFFGQLPIRNGHPYTDGIEWDAFDAINIWIDSQELTSITSVQVIGVDTDGVDVELVSPQQYQHGDFSRGHLGIGPEKHDVVFPIARPALPASPPPRVPPREEIEDLAKEYELLDHLRYHSAHYTRALYLNQNPAERARQLDAIKLNNGTLLEKIENRPLEIVGDFIAYPCADSIWAGQIEAAVNRHPPPVLTFDERLVTLPTRGLFAEAKLGHCNASEEIDNTRFWDWQASPIPHFAPDIEAIKAGQHLLKDLNLQSTPFPQSMLNIVNPPAAPDPTGLAAALNVLGTPNIFRDMSGRAEVADLLKKLSDNSISIADAANKAKDIQLKYGSNLGAGSLSVGSALGSQRAKPNEPSSALRNAQDLRNEAKKGIRDGIIQPEDVHIPYKQLLDEFGVTPGRRSLIDDPNAIASADAGFVPTDAAAGDGSVNSVLVSCTFLGQPCDGGITQQLCDRLAKVEKELKLIYSRDPSPRNPLTGDPAADFLSWCGIRGSHGGFRKNASMHTKGLAIDINYDTNPYIVTQSGSVLGGERELVTKFPSQWQSIRQATVDAYRRALAFVSLIKGEPAGLLEVNGRRAGESTSAVYDRFKLVSDAIRAYLFIALRQDLMEINRVTIPNPDSLLLDELLARIPSTERYPEQHTRDELKQIIPKGTMGDKQYSQHIGAQYRQMLVDYEILRVPFVKGHPTPNPQSTRNPAKGFLDLRKEIVLALCDEPGHMRWGISDFGASESGDVMHFDLDPKILV